MTGLCRWGGVSHVDRDGKNAWQIKAIGVVISTFETLLFPVLLMVVVASATAAVTYSGFQTTVAHNSTNS
jgi:hypothetical protein